MSKAQMELAFEDGPTGIDAVLAETAAQIDELYRAAVKPGEPAPWAALFTRISRHTHMAPFNLMLADLQRPGARYVAFADKWSVLGRQVKPGAIPIVVLWPFGPIRCAYELSDTTGSKADDALLDRVFGEPHELKYGVLEKLARRAVKEDQITIEFVKLALTLAGDARAVQGSKPEWLVRINSGLNEAAQFATIIHELAHIYLGHLGGSGRKWSDRRPARLDVREFEAEAVTFIVGRRFGLNANSADYLSSYIKNDTIQHVSFSAIARAAGRIEQHAR